MKALALVAALISSTAFAVDPASCNGNVCTVGQTGQDVVLGGLVKTTVGPLGDGGSVYLKPNGSGVPLKILGTQPSGAASTPDIVIGSSNTHTGTGSFVSFTNGPTGAEVFGINASGATGTTTTSNGNFGFIDAGAAIVGGCTFNSGVEVCTTIQGTTTQGTTVLAGFADAGSALIGGVSINGNNINFSGSLVNTAAINTSGITIGAGSLCFNGSCGLNVVGAGVGLQVRSTATPIATFNTGTGDYTVPIGFINDTDTSAGGGYRLNSKLTDTSVAPTLTGGCTSPAMSWSNGNALFQFTVGTTCAGISTIVLTFPAAADGYECKCTNTTAPATRIIDSSAWSTTTVTITNYSRTLGTAADFADSAAIRCACRGG